MKMMMITVRMLLMVMTIPVTMMIKTSVRTMQVMSKAMMQMEATLHSRIEAILVMMETTRVKKMSAKKV